MVKDIEMTEKKRAVPPGNGWYGSRMSINRPILHGNIQWPGARCCAIPRLATEHSYKQKQKILFNNLIIPRPPDEE